MSDIATKNGAIILKDGKLAENCNCCGCKDAIANAQSIEVSISSSNRVFQYRQQMINRFSADSKCCLQGSDELLTSYVFAGQAMSGTFSLTKITEPNGIASVFSDAVPFGAWYFSYADDDIAFDVTLIPNTLSLYARARGWTAWHWQLNTNSWCNQRLSNGFTWDCRSPISHSGKHYGVGERQSAINDDYTLSCLSSFIQYCSSGIGRPCYHGPDPVPPQAVGRGQRLAGATSGASATAYASLDCAQSQGGNITIGESATLTASIITDYFCGFNQLGGNYRDFMPVHEGGDAFVFRESTSGIPSVGDAAGGFTVESLSYT